LDHRCTGPPALLWRRLPLAIPVSRERSGAQGEVFKFVHVRTLVNAVGYLVGQNVPDRAVAKSQRVEPILETPHAASLRQEVRQALRGKYKALRNKRRVN
jgi:hypothetical protein